MTEFPGCLQETGGTGRKTGKHQSNDLEWTRKSEIGFLTQSVWLSTDTHRVQHCTAEYWNRNVDSTKFYICFKQHNSEAKILEYLQCIKQ